jgi:predicted DNA binding CopG/RHH family protein
MKNNKVIPHFKNEDEERDFWATHSPLEFLDSLEEVEIDLSALKPSTERISLRLPKSILDDIKIMANKRDVPYQSFIKMILAKTVQEEMGQKQARV